MALFLEKSPERHKSSKLHHPSSPGRVTRPLEAAVVSEILDFRRGYRDFLEAITDPNQQEMPRSSSGSATTSIPKAPMLRHSPQAVHGLAKKWSRVATPVNWKQGEDVIIAGSVSDEEATKLYPRGWVAPKPYLRIVPHPGQ